MGLMRGVDGCVGVCQPYVCTGRPDHTLDLQSGIAKKGEGVELRGRYA